MGLPNRWEKNSYKELFAFSNLPLGYSLIYLVNGEGLIGKNVMGDKVGLKKIQMCRNLVRRV